MTNVFTCLRKKSFHFFTVLLLLLIVGVGNAWGKEGDTAYTLTCTQNSSNTAYANTFDVVISSKTWNAPGNQYAGSGWRVGGAKGTNVSRYITGKSTIDSPIKKITVNHNGRSNSNLTINSFSVTVSKNSDFSSPIETKTVTSPSVSSAGSFDLTPTSSPWPSGCYYKFTLVYTHDKSSNYGLDLTSLVFVEGAAATSYDLTFKEWDGGGAASGSPSTGSVTANATSFSFGATAPSKTGHTIEGFYTNTSASSGVKVANSSRSFVASVTDWTNGSSQYTKGANANLYIKWSPKVCAITLDKGTSGTTDGSVSYTYGNSSMTGEISHATKTGYHLNGYYTAASSGTKILNADGTLAGNNISVSTTTYTSGGNWAYDGTSLTLYAQWTIDNYTVHWKVNGKDWEGVSHGSPSTDANYNTKPATIPTDPESSDCDNSKVFVGWTNSTYSHASTAPTILFSSQSSAPAITGNTTFHAIFADRGGSAPVASTITGSYASHTGWTESNICSGGSGGSAYWVLCSNGTLTSPSISDLSTVTSIDFSARTYGGTGYKTIVVKTNGGTSVGSTDASSATLTSGYSISVSGLSGSGSLVFSSSTNTASYGPGIDAITINYSTGGYTYSNYATTCCTKLGNIGGSVSFTNPTTAVLKWNNIAHSDSTWYVYYKTHAAGSWTSLWVDGSSDPDSKTAGTDSEITIISEGGTNNKLKVTIEDLTCNTAYDFKIVAVPDDGYCENDTTLNNGDSGFNSGTWSVTSTITNGSKTSVPTTACGDYSATFAASDGYVLPAKGAITVTGASAFDWDASTGELSIDGENITDDITISISCPMAPCDDWGFYYGTNDVEDWARECFTKVKPDDASDHEWQTDEIALPNKPNWYVDNSTLNDGKKKLVTWDNLYFAVSQGDGTRPMVGTATGATGKIRIYDNWDWDNRAAGFLPTGYVLKFGSNEYPFTFVASNEYRTGIVDLNSTTYADAVSVGIEDSNGDYVSTGNTEAVRHIFFVPSAAWKTSSAKFCIHYWDGGSLNARSDYMSAVPGKSGWYEGWLPAAATGFQFERQDPSGDAPTEGNRWTAGADQTLQSNKNCYTMTASGGESDWDGTITTSLYTSKGKFHMWDNSTSKNWYVTFCPHYVLHFDANSGSGAPDDQSVAIDASPCQITVSSTAPTRSNYTFLGWNESSSATSPDGDWDGGDTHAMTGDVTLYAVWAANHTLSYNLNGGDGSCSGGTYYTGQSFTACNNPGDKTGHTFTGWLGSNSTSYTAGTTYTMPNSDLTLTAQWSANKYTISYKDQGDVTYSGSNSASLPTQHTYGVATDLVPGVKSGYRFDGWFTTSTCTGDAVTSIGATAITANTTYYAKWTQVYTVTWYVNGEEWESGVVDGNTIVPVGTKVSALPTAPTKSDCDDAKKFIGWTNSEYSDATDAPTLCFTDVSGSPEIDDDVTFYAVFADVVEGSVSWDLVTNASSLQENDIITFTSTCTYNYSATAYYDTVAYAGKNSTLGAAVPIGITSDKIRTIKSGSISEVKLIEGSTSGKWKLYDVTSEKYLNDADKGISYDETGDDATITITDGVATVTIGSYNLQYNPNNNAGDYSKARFAYYSSTQKAIQIYKKTEIKTSITNYVTTCASCDEDATYSNTTPTVSEIDCTTATLTMEGGLATVGSEGCHISDYGFVIGTEDDPEIDGDGVTKLQVGTSDPTTGADFSYDATGLTKGTHYYLRAYATNKHGTAYSTSTNFWTKNVSSIAITTAPTKTNYIVGETFDATGMVVTATMASGATEDVTSDVTYSSSALTAGASQNFAINYSLCETEKSVNQTINVYTLSLSEGTNPSYGDYSTSANVITVNPGSGKTYSLSVTNATAVDNMDGTYSIINPTGNVTATIDYRDATTVKVYYKVDGKTVIEQDVTESTTATLPTASDLATAIANNDLELPEGTIYTNLWGWSESEFTAQTEEPNIVSSPTIHASKTFYAVYTNMYKKQILPSDFSGTYSENDGEKTYDGVGYNVSNICKQSEKIQFRSSPGYLYSTSALQYIKKIEITGLDLIVNACSDNEGTLDGDAITPTGSDKYVYTFPANKQYFKIKGKGGTDQVSRIDIYYATATPKFMTTFCDDKIGAPTVTATKVSTAANKATVTLSWDAVANATGYKVKWGSISNDWEDVGTERTYVKENVSTGTKKWFVKAKYDEANYCGANIAKGSTTVNTAYEVAYDANKTSYTGDEPEGGFYESGETITLSTTELAASRFHWDGWEPYNMETSAAIPVSTGTFTMPAADVLIQGQWTEVLSGDEVYITSAKDITTMSSMAIIVTRETFTSGTMTVANVTGDQGGTFHAVIDGAEADASDGLYALVKIEYTPSKANVTESATMTAVVGSESYDFTVYGRSLPEDFVIVAKVGAAWTALPADATSAGLQQGYSLTLDDATTPTKSTLAPASAVFHYYAKSAKTTDYIRLAGKDNSKALWGNATTNIKMNAAIGGGYATGDAYEWQLATTDNATYTLHNDNSSRYLGVNNDKKWGTHAAGKTASNILYFLPVDATVDHIGMEVSSWGEASFTFTTSDDIPSYDHVAVECNGDSKSATMSGSGPYTISIPTMDFEDYSGASLVVQWFDNEDVALAQGAVLLPIFITADNTDFEGYDPDILSATDVHIINKSTLTITTNRSVHDLSIEGGSTLNISTTGGGAAVTFNMNSLYLRGGWNDDYTDYDMPRIYIHPKSTLSKTQNTVNFDISVDSRNYYPFAVPFPVTVSAVDYVNSTLAGASQYGKHYVIKEYDGANRAENGAVDANWKIVEDGTVYGTSSATLQPGKGYILTAVSIPAYGGGVIRFPMSFTNAWTAKGEQATIDEENYKNSVTVTAHTGTAATASKCHAGWNMIANPYMSCYGMYSGDGTASILTGKMVVSDGKVSWDDDGLTYVSVPTHDFSEYIQKEITDDTADSPKDAQLLPGWSFFVQIGTSGTLTFLTANEQADSDLPIYAPKRTAAEQKVVKTGIVLSSETASDKTTFLISDRYSSEYEIGADLEKMFGNGYTLATYSINNDTRLAFNAMSTAQANELIPIGVRLPADGEYTFSLNERYADADIERLDLIDYETGEVTDLMATDYIFYATRSQNDERFALNVQRGKETATDIGGADIGAPEGARKILLNGTIFIVRDGLLYDATGKRVQTNK